MAFGHASAVGLTRGKIYEALRLLDGNVTVLKVGPQQHMDLCNQLNPYYDQRPQWCLGILTEFMDIPIKLMPDWRGKAVMEFQDQAVEILCYEYD